MTVLYGNVLRSNSNLIQKTLFVKGQGEFKANGVDSRHHVKNASQHVTYTDIKQIR